MYAKFFLIVVKGPKVGKKYFFDKGFVNIGRNSGNDITLEDNSVSGEHARITFENTGLFLHDLESKNGTYHYREGYVETKRKILLRDGDQFKLGNTLLRFLEYKKITDGLHLVVTKGPETGKVFSFYNEPIHIGRTVIKNDLSLNNQSISKKHAKITFEDGQILLQDLESKNRTYFNNYPLSADEKVAIQAEDEFCLGNTVSFRVSLKMNQHGRTVMMPESPIKDIIGINDEKIPSDFSIIGGLIVILFLLLMFM